VIIILPFSVSLRNSSLRFCGIWDTSQAPHRTPSRIDFSLELCHNDFYWHDPSQLIYGPSAFCRISHKKFPKDIGPLFCKFADLCAKIPSTGKKCARIQERSNFSMKAIAELRQLSGETNRQYEKRLENLATDFLKQHSTASRSTKNRRRQRDKARKAKLLEKLQLMQFELLPGIRELENAAAVRLGHSVLVAFQSEDNPTLSDHVELRVDDSQFKLLAIYLWFVDENGVPYRRTELGHKQLLYPGLPVPYHFVNGCPTDFRRDNITITPRRPRGVGKHNKGRTKRHSITGFGENIDADTIRRAIHQRGMLGQGPDE
jgi:hypothetical protein